MRWRFVGRRQQVAQVDAALAAERAHPVVVVGEPGLGRTSLLRRALEHVDSAQEAVLVLGAAGPEPFAALRGHIPEDLPGSTPTRSDVARATEALVGAAEGRRPVLVMDDVHLADHATVRVMLAALRSFGAKLLVTLPARAGERARPTDSLRYARDAQVVTVLPLTGQEVADLLTEVLEEPVHAATAAALHAATAGSPQILRVLVTPRWAAQNLVRRDGALRLADPVEPPEGDADLGPRLLAAVRGAWRDLDLELLAELSPLAAACVGRDAVAVPMAFAALLSGCPEDGIAMLATDGDGDGEGDGDVATRTAHGLLLGLGRRDVDGAARLLGGQPEVLAWLLAGAGRAAQAAEVLRGPTRGTAPFAVPFAWAARAAVALAAGRPTETVTHLRRATVAAQRHRDDLPWLEPHLIACLSDALALVGRHGEAAAMTTGLRTVHDGRALTTATALAALLRHLRAADGASRADRRAEEHPA